MTEQINEVQESPKEPTFTDEMQKMAFGQISNFIKQRNSLVGKANAANGDRSAITEDLTENSNDPEVVAAREARDEANARLDSLIEPLVEAQIAAGTEGLAGVEESLKEIDQVVKPGVSYYKKLYGDKAAEFLPTQARIKGTRVSNSGTGGKRIRGFNVIVTANGQVEEFENFASAAKWVGKETSDLQAAFFTAAGSSDLKEISDKVAFSVEFTETDEDGQSETLTASVVAYRTESAVTVEDATADAQALEV